MMNGRKFPDGALPSRFTVKILSSLILFDDVTVMVTSPLLSAIIVFEPDSEAPVKPNSYFTSIDSMS